MSFHLSIEIVGWIGVVAYLVAYAMLSTGYLSGRSRNYQFLNLAGALGVAANAFYYQAFPSAIVNVIWFAIASTTLVSLFRMKEGNKPVASTTKRWKLFSLVLIFVSAVIVVVMLGFLILLYSPTHLSRNPQISIATNDWSPLIRQNKDNTVGGPLGDLTEQIFQNAGFETEIKFLNWEKCLEEVTTGDSEAAFTYHPSKDRINRYYFTEPIFQFVHVLFFKPNVCDYEDLLHWVESENTSFHKKFTLGHVEGYSLWPKLLDSVKETKHFSTLADAFEALDRGEIDLLPESQQVGREFLANNDRFNYYDFDQYWSPDGVMEGAVLSQHIVVARTRGGLQLRNRLNATIQKLKENGKLITPGRSSVNSESAKLLNRSIVRTSRTSIARSRSGSKFALPRGTIGVVLNWPEGFDGELFHVEQMAIISAKECLLKIRNGPLSGQLLYLPVKHIEMVSNKDGVR